MKIHIDMDPVAKGRPRMTRSGHAYTPQKTRDAEARIKEMLEFSLNNMPPLEGPLYVKIDCTFKKPKSNKTTHHIQKPDAENISKLVNDAMNGLVYFDDSQIVHLEVTKKWGDCGGIDIRVEPY